MTPLVLGLGVPELLIIRAVGLLLSAGRGSRVPAERHRARAQGVQGGDEGLRSEEEPAGGAPPRPAAIPNAPLRRIPRHRRSPNRRHKAPNGATYQPPPRANQDPSGTERRNDELESVD